MRSWGTSDSTGVLSGDGHPGQMGHTVGTAFLATAYLANRYKGRPTWPPWDAHRDAIVGCAQGCDRGMRTGMRSWEAAVGRHLLLDVDAVFDPIVDLMNCGAADLSPVTLGTGLLAFAT